MFSKETKRAIMNDLDCIDVSKLEKMMEEMANAPREEMGKRQPGEKCMYEQDYERKHKLRGLRESDSGTKTK